MSTIWKNSRKVRCSMAGCSEAGYPLKPHYRGTLRSAQGSARASHRAWYCLLLLILFLLRPTTAFAITEAQFTQKVLNHDKSLEEAQIGLDIKQIELDASRDNYQNWKTNLSFNLGYRYRDLDRDTTSNYSYIKKSQQHPQKINLSFEKRFLSNPSSFEIGVSRSNDKTSEVQYKKHTHKNDYDLREYQTEQYISFNYPLLRHDRNAASLKSYQRNILYLKRQKLLFYETKESFLEDRLNDYLSWVSYQQQASINQEFLNKLRRLQAQDKKEETLLKSTVSQIENHNRTAQNKLHAIKQKLAVLLDDQNILTETPTFDLHKRIEPIKKDLPNYLQTYNRSLQRIALNIELNQIDIAYYQNQSLAKLDFTARAERNQNNRNSRTSTYDDDAISYAVGLEFNYPLGGNITNQASLQKSLLGVRKLEIKYQDNLQDIMAEMQLLNVLLQLDESKLLDTIEATAQSTRIEYENYQSGQTSFRDLLQAHKDERSAKLDYMDKIITYQLNSIKYDNLADRIIIGHIH